MSGLRLCHNAHVSHAASCWRRFVPQCKRFLSVVKASAAAAAAAMAGFLLLCVHPVGPQQTALTP